MRQRLLFLSPDQQRKVDRLRHEQHQRHRDDELADQTARPQTKPHPVAPIRFTAGQCITAAPYGFDDSDARGRLDLLRSRIQIVDRAVKDVGLAPAPITWRGWRTSACSR